jgi:hypothetical protein
LKLNVNPKTFNKKCITNISAMSKAQSVEDGSTIPSTDFPNTSDFNLERLRPSFSDGLEKASDLALKARSDDK